MADAETRQLLIQLSQDFSQQLGRFALEFNKKLGAMDKRFGAIDRQFGAIDGRFDTVDKRFQAMDGRFEAMDKRFDEVDTRFNKVDERFDEMDNRFEVTNKRADGFDARLTRTEVLQEEMSHKLDAIIEIVVPMHRDVMQLKNNTDMAEIKGDIKVIKQVLTETNKNIADHERRITRLETKAA